MTSPVVRTLRDSIREFVAQQRHASTLSRPRWRPDFVERLRAINADTASVADLAAAIGWPLDDFGPLCDGCHQNVIATVEVGEEPDYESATARLCLTCVDAARSALAAVEP